ncbi:hypothetical protein CYK37_25975 [Mesorhizobium loti]|nr:hypothetical protein [Mesorhizobium loti]PLP56233.1 hypothetical protein CYK37_25975 [Mesorhizobium loti]
MKRPLPARLLSEAWDAVIEAKAASGYVNVSAIATTIRRTGRFQNVPLPGIEKAVLHATLAVGAVIEFDKGENPAAALRLPGSGATVQSDGAQLSMLQEK